MPKLRADNPSECTGCGICAAACPKRAISMNADRLGFPYPVLNGTLCVDCRKCESLCFRALDILYDAPSYICAMTHRDRRVKEKSSSGGVFYALSEYVISQGGSVCGAALGEDLILRHQIVSELDEIGPLQGSKYVQSRLTDVLPEMLARLKDHRPLLFVGTPCQFAGVRALVPELLSDSLITCDLLCYGVPSPAVFSSYISALEREYGSKAVGVNFRDKRNGWRDYSISVSFENGTEYVRDKWSDPFSVGFQRLLTIRDSCYECPYRGFRRTGDITLGDFWDFHESFGRESIIDDKTGISFVSVNTPKGTEIWSRIEKKGIAEIRLPAENGKNYGLDKDLHLRVPS